MRLILLSLCAVLMIGCETAPPEERDYTFQEMELVGEDFSATTGQPLPKLEELRCYPSTEDCKVAGYTDPKAVATLDAFRAIAKENYTIANLNAEAIEALQQRIDELILAGRLEEEISALRQEDFEFEKSMMRRSIWYHRVLLVLAIGAGIAVAGD